MTEETNTENTQEQTETEATFDRSHPAFLAVTKQLNELKAAMADKEATEKKAAEEAERKKLEEKGQYETLLAQFQRDILQRDVKMAMLQAGAQNDVFIDGAISRYTGDAAGIAEYVEQLKAAESNAAFFGVHQPETTNGIPPAKSAKPATGGTNNWKTIKADLQNPDWARVQAAQKAVNEYVAQNGALPPGFDD